MAGGGAIYTVANAQTLYFLEILKTAPNFFRFVLVAYADFLITASIALFGVPILLTTYTFGISNSGSTAFGLEVDFKRLTVDPLQETLRSLAGGKPESAPTPPNPDPDEFTVDFSFADPATNVAAMQADYEAIQYAVKHGIIKGTETPRGKALALYNARGQLVSIREMGQPYKGRVTSYLGYSKKVVNPKERFCREFSVQSSSRAGTYVVAPKSADVAESILQACRTYQKVVITLPVKINTANVSYGTVYKKYLFFTLNDLIFSVASGFESYLTISPYAIFTTEANPSIDSIWITESYSRLDENLGARLFDEMMFDALLQREGGNNLFSHFGLPGGTINFAIMSTAAFNLAVMSVFFVIYPLIKLSSKLDLLHRYLAFDKAPFTVVGSALAIWLAVILFIMSAF
jgi:hypothetical protein